MTELRDRIRAAEGADRELDKDIMLALDPEKKGVAPAFTSDIREDIKALPTGARWRVGHDRIGPTPEGETTAIYAVVRLDGETIRHLENGKDGALALINAFLKSLGK